MKFIRLKLCALLLSGISLAVLHAQNAIPAAGGDASGSSGSVSYSVGQVVYTTTTGTGGFVAQGIQQAYVISGVSGIEQAKGITLECSVYPNPATDFLSLKIENYCNERLMYQLLDINGKRLASKKTEGEVSTISMEDFIPGIYFLKVTNNKKEIKTFTIIKN